jgi:DUF917 family protein
VEGGHAPVRTITEDDLTALATGATLLGTGGGGDPYIGLLMAQAALAKHGPIPLVDLDELPAKGLVMPAAMIGAPTVIVEKIPNGTEMRQAVRALERLLSEETVAVMSIEAGGLNSIIPLTLAAELGLPLVDADGIGRAFPEVQMTSFTINGVPATPMSLVDDKGNTVTIETVDNLWTERFARTATVQMGGSALIAIYPMTTAVARKASIPGTIRLAMELGRIVEAPGLDREERLRRLLARMGGARLFEGKVQDVLRRTTGGFARGTATLTGYGAHQGQVMRIEFQNENLMALRDGVPMAMVPDLISVLDQETLRPITTEALAYGQRVIVVASPCQPIWRTPRGIEIAGPRYFGYDFDYVPFPGGDAA